jgi:hypothetical protein
MAKALDYTFEFPYSPEEMFQEGIRLEYVVAQAKALNHYNIELVTLEDGPDGGHAVATYEIDVELPGWAKKILQPRNKITEQRDWVAPEADGSRSYSFTVRLENVPAEIKGVVRLAAAAGGGTRNEVHADIKSSVPIFGGKLEDLVARDLSKTIEAEAGYMTTWMKENKG